MPKMGKSFIFFVFHTPIGRLSAKFRPVGAMCRPVINRNAAGMRYAHKDGNNAQFNVPWC